MGKLLFWLVADRRVVNREDFGDREVGFIAADNEWARRWIASLIYRTVREAPASRWTVDELLIGLERTNAKLAEYEAHAEAGEIVIWDGFGPARAFNAGSSRSATRSTRDGNEGAHDVAVAVDVAGNEPIELVRMEVALADIGAGSGAVVVHVGRDGSVDDPVTGPSQGFEFALVTGEHRPDDDDVIERFAGHSSTTAGVLTLSSERRPVLEGGRRYWLWLSATDLGGRVAWQGADEALVPLTVWLAERDRPDRWRAAESKGGPGFALLVVGANVEHAAAG